MAITIPILTDFNGSGISKATKQFKNLEGSGKKAAFAIRKAAIPAGIALVALGAAAVDMAKAAIEDEAAADKLAGTLKRVMGATDDGVSAAERLITKLSRQTAVADDELRPALSKLVIATGDLDKAQVGLEKALDLSAATGKPLESAVTAVAKAYAGNGTALGKLVPGLNKAILKSGNLKKINEELARVTGGAATDAANTAAGKWKGLGVRFEEVKEKIGLALIPAFEKLMDALDPVLSWLEDNTKVVVALGVAIAGVAVAVIAANAALSIMAAAAAISNPVIAVILGVAALTAALIILYKKNEDFKKLMDDIWPAIRDAVKVFVEYAKGPFMAIVTGITGSLQLIRGIVEGDFTKAWEGLKTMLGGVFDWIIETMVKIPGKIALVALDIGIGIVTGIATGVATLGETVWDKVKGLAAFLWEKALSWATGLKGIAGDILGWMTDGLGGFAGEIWGKISGFADDLVTKVAGLAGKIKGIGKDIVGWVGDGIETAWTAVVKIAKDGINLVIAAINGGIKSVNLVSGVINKVVPFGDPVPKIDMIPKLAAGGIVTRPTLALIGEAGPEAVIPLSGRNAPGGMGGITITVNAGLVSTPDQIGQQIIEAIQKAQRRSGPVFAAA